MTPDLFTVIILAILGGLAGMIFLGLVGDFLVDYIEQGERE